MHFSMEMIILMGLQASGKSTFYRAYFAATYEHVSKDLLHRSKHKNKGQEQAEHIESAFQEQRSVVVGNTNSTLQDRHRLIELGRTYGARIIRYYFPPPLTNTLTLNTHPSYRPQLPANAR